MPTLTEMIYSNDYADLILSNYQVNLEEIQNLDPEIGKTLYASQQYSILYYQRRNLPENQFDVLPYNVVPCLYTPQDTTSLEASGILQLQNQSLLNLTGQGVLIGIIDTGINYTHPAFLDSQGRTRILKLWDQTISEDARRRPFDFPYGSEYTSQDINQALSSDNPLTLVPTIDETGHGTAVAGIAAGSPSPANEFAGAAPGSELVVVKLKEAKQYLKDLYLISGNSPAFAENDILTALSYLTRISEQEQKPMILCLALGSNQGGHTGSQPLEVTLNRFSQFRGLTPVIPCGNESGKAHHFYGVSGEQSPPTTVEILVPEGSRGFSCELWGQVPQIFSVSFRTPLGEIYPRIPITLQGNDKVSFVLENTIIYVNYDLAQSTSGNQLILMRFVAPTPGVWTLSVYPNRPGNLDYHMWLPITEFNQPDVRFLSPNPYTTLTTPSPADSAISVAAYNAANNSLFIHSGRGYTVAGSIKPDFAAPGVDVTAPGPGNSYITFTGTSASAAITAGACALLTEWGLRRNPPLYFTTHQIKIYLIRGCVQTNPLSYPNREWGYGTLNLYQTFLALTTAT